MKKTAVPRAAVAGALSVDICPGFNAEGAEDFSDVIKPGKITRITGSEIHPGGPVANTGMALSILGTEPVLLARTGRDGFSRMLLGQIAEKTGRSALGGITEDPDGYTAYSVIMAVPGLDRAILQNPGANDLFGPEDLDPALLEGVPLFHFGHPSTMKRMYENGGSGLVEVMKKAKSMGMLTSLDLCAVDPLSEAGQEDWAGILSRVLPLTDFFLPSIGDIDTFLGSGPGSDPEYLAGRSISMGASNVLIKLGERGMYYRNAGSGFFSAAEEIIGLSPGSLSSWADRRGFRDAVKVKKEVSGLGAGDTSIAAYISALLRGMPFDDAVFLAAAEGALCVTEASAVGGLRPFEEVLSWTPEQLQSGLPLSHGLDR